MAIQEAFKLAFDTARPEACRDCPHLEPAATAHFENILDKGGDLESAVTAGLNVIDPLCPGMQEKEVPEGVIANDPCCMRERECGRKEGPSFLLKQAYGLRIEPIQPDLM